MEKTQQNLEKQLEALGLPYKELQVYGTINTRITVKVSGEETARKWHMILAKFSEKVTTIEGRDFADKNAINIDGSRKYQKYFLIGATI